MRNTKRMKKQVPENLSYPQSYEKAIEYSMIHGETILNHAGKFPNFLNAC
jgi:hypothetical protein